MTERHFRNTDNSSGHWNLFQTIFTYLWNVLTRKALSNQFLNMLTNNLSATNRVNLFKKINQLINVLTKTVLI